MALCLRLWGGTEALFPWGRLDGGDYCSASAAIGQREGEDAGGGWGPRGLGGGVLQGGGCGIGGSEILGG